MRQEQGSGNRLKAALEVIRDLIDIIIGLLAISGLSSLSAFFAILLHLPITAFLLMTLGAMALIILVVVIARYRKARSVPIVKWLLRGYKLLSVEYVYCIHDLERLHHSQTIIIRLKAIQYGVELLEVRYGWTGSGVEKSPQSKTKGHHLLGSIQPGYVKPETRGLWKYYYIHFGRELFTNEVVTTEIVQEFEDSNHAFQPFLAKTITEPVDKLILRVKMPAGLKPQDIFFTERASGDPTSRQLRRRSGKYKVMGQEHEIRWELSKLAFGHRYAIEWDYSHNSP